jgi:hypothetical protein
MEKTNTMHKGREIHKKKIFVQMSSKKETMWET